MMLRSCQIIIIGELLSGKYVRHLEKGANRAYEAYVFICG